MSMEKANNLKISILGKPYLVTTDEAQENVLEASELVDNMMKEKIKNSPIAGEARVAVVSALELATELGRFKRFVRTFENRVDKLNELLEFALR
jgi:cell division protein ZapA (FtsZ GTPase activity inhibitor)